MSYEVLARKWRPAHFAQMVGQEAVVRALQHALEQNRLHHAYLFTGTRGVGKTTVARILARCLNCEKGVSPEPCDACTSCEEIRSGRFPDLIEVDAASRTKVEDTRELLENVQYMPVRGRFKIYLIDEVHMLSGHSFNALLKTLEEPPEHVKFLLATTDPQKLPATVLSRCLQFHLRQVPAAEIASYLQTMLKGEEISAAPAALQQLAEAAQGSVRDAISLTDQAISHGGGRLEERGVREMLGTVDRGRVVRLLETLADEDGPALLQEVGQLAELCPDYEGVLKELLSALHRMAVFQAVPELLKEQAEDAQGEELQALAKRITPERLQLFYQAGVIGRRDFYLAPDPRSSLEMTLLRMLSFLPATQAAPLEERKPQQAPAAQPQSAQAPAAAQQTEAPAGDAVQTAAQSDDAHTAAEVSPPAAAPENAGNGAAQQNNAPDAAAQLPPAQAPAAAQQTEAPAGDAVQTAAQSDSAHTTAAASPPAAAPENTGNGAVQQNNALDAAAQPQSAQASAAAQQTATPTGDAVQTAAQPDSAHTTAAASPPAAAPENAGNGAAQQNNAPDAAALAARQSESPVGDAQAPQTAEQQEAEQRFLQDPGVRRLKRHLPVELEPGSLRVYGD